MQTSHQKTSAWIAKTLGYGMLLWAAHIPIASAQPTYTVAKKLSFSSPTKNQRAMLVKGGKDEEVRDIAKGDFSLAMVDLNDDGKEEIILASHEIDWCGSIGCWNWVLEKRDAKWIVLTRFQTDGGISVTNEKSKGYRYIAILDDKGKIANINRERYGPSIIKTAPDK